MDPILQRLSHPQATALTIVGEARSEPFRGQLAVGQTIWHRVEDQRWPDTFREVCLQPRQFSCWNDDDPNYPMLVEYAKIFLGLKVAPLLPTVLSRALAIAEAVIEGVTKDVIFKSTHYHVATMKPLPKWARGHTPVVVISRHAFYNDIP